MNVLRLTVALALTLLPAWLAAQPVQTEHVEAELIAERDALVAGARNWVALRLRPDDGWHVYWRNPGDSGLPTELAWSLPEGISAGEIHWPFPHRESLGELTNYGYGEQTLHLVPLDVAAPAGGDVTLQATAEWLVCKDVCIPGEADLSLTLPVRDADVAPSRWAQAFAETRALLPRVREDWQARFEVADGELRLAVDGATMAGLADAQFFPYAGDLVAHAAAQRIALDASGMRLAQQRSPYATGVPAQVSGVLVVPDGAHGGEAYEIHARPGAVAAVTGTRSGPGGPSTAAGSASPAPAALPASLPWMLAFAALGGLILNLMPCVFPVLSLKAMSVMSASREDRGGHRRHALAYTAGVLVSFLLVAIALIALRAGGAAIGWGFQLQSPIFVALLVYVLFALGLSLSGVVVFGTRWMGAGQRLTEHPGLAGSFFTGVLAVVVASPCTAPFMGTALGFALTQSPAVALPVFAALGLGMALPFLLLGFVPRLAAVLPRPGAWMETFKQVLAFPMYLTAIWLLWVLGGLTDRHGMGIALVGLVALAFALWLLGKPGRLAPLFSAAGLAAALALLLHPAIRTPSDPAVAEARLGWEPYSDARLAELRAAGRTVFVDFTADWCITCKVNERVALDSRRVQDAFAERDVALLIGDWTRADPAITEVLRRYERSGVPLYLVSRAGAEPEVLPQILTPEIVVDALDAPLSTTALNP